MEIAERRYTAEEFSQIAQLPENENRRLELDEGVIVDIGSSSQENTVIGGRIIHFLNTFVIPAQIGYVTTPDGGFKLGPGRVRQPDTAYISSARHPKLEGVQFPVAPDLAVEIVSPDEDGFKKVNEYFAAGCRLVWAVYPAERRVYVFHPPENGEMRVYKFGVDDILDGGDVLPGFKLAVRDIFPG